MMSERREQTPPARTKFQHFRTAQAERNDAQDHDPATEQSKALRGS
jgi:hypothetical protein